MGVCQFLPMFLLTLPAGEISDRYDQRKVYAIALAMQGICSAIFMVLSLRTPHNTTLFYATLVLFGAARGFSAPSGSSLLAFLVPQEKLARSIAINSSVFTTAVIAGPALGGLLFLIGPMATYGLCMTGFFVAASLMETLGGRQTDRSRGDASRFERVAEGVRFVWQRPVVLGAISLDLFAVLLGGAVALLPVYARDILHVGPLGLGALRSAPAVGAAITALLIARRPIERHAGVSMFACVAIFGIATIVFGLSRSFAISLIALAVTGASDMVSVFVRTALINFATPDAMRGRVGAVNAEHALHRGVEQASVRFRSGFTAAWFGHRSRRHRRRAWHPWRRGGLDVAVPAAPRRGQAHRRRRQGVTVPVTEACAIAERASIAWTSVAFASATIDTPAIGMAQIVKT